MIGAGPFRRVTTSRRQVSNEVDAGALRAGAVACTAQRTPGRVLTQIALHAHQVHVMFRARLADPSYGVGVESLEVKLCAEQEVPWPDLAFQSVAFTLRRYFEDRAAGRRELHFKTIE